MSASLKAGGPRRWWCCPECGAEHYIRPTECRRGDAGPPLCSRCALSGRDIPLRRGAGVSYRVRNHHRAREAAP